MYFTGFYVFGLAYLVLPAVGLPFDSSTLVDTWATAPDWLFQAFSLVAYLQGADY